MENASKALILIGGVLIAILLISLGLAFANNMQKQSSIYYKTLSEEEISKINNQLTKDIFQSKYGEKTCNFITAQGLVSLKATISNLDEKGISITNNFNWTGDEQFLRKSNEIDPTKISTDKITYYKITITYDANTGMIKELNYDNTQKYYNTSEKGKKMST